MCTSMSMHKAPVWNAPHIAVVPTLIPSMIFILPFPRSVTTIKTRFLHHLFPPLAYAPKIRCNCSNTHPPHNKALQRFRVLLVAPQHAGNVGSVCRVAANFECQDIWLVDPRCDHLEEEAYNSAANTASRALLSQVRVESSLESALQDCSMAVAFTRRTGLHRLPSLSLADLQDSDYGSSSTALVFGREDCGLSTEELHLCTHVCTIPSAAREGSLNLSHAVAVVLSRLYESSVWVQEDVQCSSHPYSTVYNTLPGTATIGDVENLLRRIYKILLLCNQAFKQIGKAEYKDPERIAVFVRKFLQRARPAAREIAFLHGFLSVVETLAITFTETLEIENHKAAKND